MRLDKVATGHGWIDKLRFAWRELHTGRGVTDIQRALFYRADFFGTAFGRYWREAQYDSPSQLSIGERQVLAAIISQSNRCLFCTVGHAEAASRYVPVDTVDSMLRGDDAVMGPRMRALAVFARKLTVTPGDVGPDDVGVLREQGIGDPDIKVTIHLCGAYSIINRVADGLDFDVPDIYHLEVEPTSGRIRLKSRDAADSA